MHGILIYDKKTPIGKGFVHYHVTSSANEMRMQVFPIQTIHESRCDTLSQLSCQLPFPHGNESFNASNLMHKNLRHCLLFILNFGKLWIRFFGLNWKISNDQLPLWSSEGHAYSQWRFDESEQAWTWASRQSIHLNLPCSFVSVRLETGSRSVVRQTDVPIRCVHSIFLISITSSRNGALCQR